MKIVSEIKAKDKTDNVTSEQVLILGKARGSKPDVDNRGRGD